MPLLILLIKKNFIALQKRNLLQTEPTFRHLNTDADKELESFC